MMAKGSPSYRRLVTSSTGTRSQRSPCNFQSAKALTDGHGRNLDHNIKQDILRRTGKQVKAFVYMAVYDDGDVMTHATDNLQQCTDDIFASNAKECLRTSVLQERSDFELHEKKTVPLSELRDVVSARDCRNDDLFSMRMPQLDDESCPASRPGSARTFGSTNCWPSDTDSPRLSQAPSTGEMRVDSIVHAKRPAEMQSLMICDASKVEDFLVRALRTMQQLAVKRIAKAWIKGICPRKQAVFPYNNKKKKRGDGAHDAADNPGWWPDESLCVFVEPDHIKRDERVNLCLHLLRLRPTPQQLKEWNKDTVEPHPTHETKGWTEFLKELAPPSIFAEAREPDDKTEERQKLLAQAYELAQREEQYVNGEIDSTDRFYWHNDVLSKASIKRKSRHSFDASVDESDVDSMACAAPPSKRSKKTSVATTPAGSPVIILPKEVEHDDQMQDCKPPVLVEPFMACGAMAESHPRSASAASSTQSWTHDAKDPNIMLPMQEQVQVAQSAPGYPQPHLVSSPWVGTSMAHAFNASIAPKVHSMPQEAFSTEAPASTYPGCHNYQFPPQNPRHAPAYSSPYVQTQFSQPPLESLSVSTSYTPPLMATPAYAGQGHCNNNTNIDYYGQPDIAQSQLFAVPGVTNINTQFGYTAPPNSPFSHYPMSQDPCCTVGPVASYQYHPETEQPSYSLSETRHSNAFQAPARVERGFTGHGSGVGGGAHT